MNTLHPAYLLVPVLVALFLGCSNDSDKPEVSAPTPTAGVTATATPSPQASASVSEKPSWWGWKGVFGEFALWTVKVIPGANPEVDRWSFVGDGLGANGEGSVECQPEKRATGWEFRSCLGLRNGDVFHAIFSGDEELEVDIRLAGRLFRQKLTRVQEKDESESSPNVRLLWHTPGPAGSSINSGIWAADGLVFAPHFGGVIEILDAASGARLAIASVAGASGRNPSAVSEVTARDGYLYAATTSKGVVVFDVRDPRQPRLAGQYVVDAGRGSLESFTNVHTIFLGPDSKTLYAVNQSHETTDLRMLDVSNPAAPREIGRYLRREVTQVLDGFHDVHVIERQGKLIAFLQSLRSGLLVLDVSDPAAATLLGSIKWENTLSHSGAAFEAGGKLYYAHNDEGFDQGMTVLDLSDLTRPRIVARYQTRRGTSIHNIEIVDNIAYVSYYVDGLRVVDLRDPLKPREIGHYDTVPDEDEEALFQGAWGVKVLDGRVFISDMESGTFAFEVRLPD